MKVPGHLLAGALFALQLCAPLALDRYWVDVLNSIGLYAILGLSLNIILGYAGMFHMGHAAFYAIGAYTTAILNTSYGVPVLWRSAAWPRPCSPWRWPGRSSTCAATTCSSSPSAWWRSSASP